MEQTNLLYCPRCGEQAKEIIVVLESDVKMVWDEKEQDYVMVKTDNDFKEIKQQVCATCLTELIEPPIEE